MKKKILLCLMICLICLCLIGCEQKHDHDTVEIYNISNWTFDNVRIKIKDKYFYDSHEKFTVDENTIGLTIYFSNGVEDSWD